MKYEIKAELLYKYIEKLEEYLKYILKYACVIESNKSTRMTNFENELASLKSQLLEQKEPTAMEMIRDVFEPIQLGEDTVVNQILELASKKAGKIKSSRKDNEPPKYPLSNRTS